MNRRILLSAVLAVLLISTAPCLSASSTQPVAVPYAADRALVESAATRVQWTDVNRDNRVVPAKIYSPSSGRGPFPVIIFSHGLGGSRENYEYLGRQWAANGYVVVHLQHAGSDDRVWRGQQHPAEALRQAANAQNSVARARDVSFAIDRMEKLADQPDWKGRLDLDHIGVAGHSFGGQTSMLVAGELLGGKVGPRMFGQLADPRVKAVLPMSPPVPARRDKLDEVYGSITIPVFEMTGTQDDSPLGDSLAADRRIPFDHLKSGDAYLLTLTDGDHMVFSGRSREQVKPTDGRHQEIIRIASTAFWDAYLKNDASARQWLREGALKTNLKDDARLEIK
jgi:predicted dienelactone hydrolase